MCYVYIRLYIGIYPGVAIRIHWSSESVLDAILWHEPHTWTYNPVGSNVLRGKFWMFVPTGAAAGGANALLNMAPAYIHNCPDLMYVKRPRPTYTIANYLCTWNLICFCAWPAQGGPSTAYCRGGECTSSIWPSAAPSTHPPRPSHYPTNRPVHNPQHHPPRHPTPSRPAPPPQPPAPAPTAPHTTPSTAPSAAPKADTTCHKIPAQKKFRGQIKKWNQGSVAPQQAPGPWGWSIP